MALWAGSAAKRGSAVVWPSGSCPSEPEDARVTEDTPFKDGPEEPEPPTIQSMKSNERLFRQRRALANVAAVAGVLLILGSCGLAGLGLQASIRAPAGDAHNESRLWRSALACDHAAGEACPARSLLEMPEVHAVAAENLMRLGRRLRLPQDAVEVREAVGACFRNVSGQLTRRAPQLARELDLVHFTRAQRGAVLGSLQLVGNSRVQGLGLDVAEAIRDSKPAPDAEAKAEAMATKLDSLIGGFKLGAFRKDLEGKPLLWSEGPQWALTLEPENLRAVSSVSGQWRAIMAGATPGEAGGAPMLTHEEQHAAVVAGALEQARALLGIMGVRARSQVPGWATSASGYLGVDPEQCSCDLAAARGTLGRFDCPMRFGIQGMDALRAYFASSNAAADAPAVHAPRTQSTGDGYVIENV